MIRDSLARHARHVLLLLTLGVAMAAPPATTRRVAPKPAVVTPTVPDAAGIDREYVRLRDDKKLTTSDNARLEHMLRLRPSDRATRKKLAENYLSRSYKSRDALPDAQANVAALLAEDGNDPEALFLAGRVQMVNNVPLLAVPYFERAVKQAPANPMYHIALGEALSKVGRQSEADLQYQEFRRLTRPTGDIDQPPRR